MKESINKIIMMNPLDLIPYNKNARIHDVDKIANSIREFGFKDVILIDEHNVIINGHGRHKASLKIGLKQVPVAIAKDLSDEEIKALRLADNKTAECTEWDNVLLAKELASLGDIPYTRTIEHKHFLNEESDVSVISKEFPISKGEPFYPINNSKTNAIAEKYLEDAKKCEIIALGRLGRYKYLNMDEAVKEAIKTALSEGL